MSEIFPKDILLRCGGRTWLRHGVLAVAGARKGLVEVPVTFTRADASTCATYIDQDGIVRLAAANVPRIEYPPALSGLVDQFGYPYCGPSLEGSRQNACIFSEDLTNGTYSPFHVSVTANATPAPDGQATADKIVEDATNNAHAIFGNTRTITDGQITAASIFLKAAERSKIRCQLVDSLSVSGRFADVDLATGVINSTGISAGSPGAIVQPWTLVKLANGWYRLSVAFNVGAGKLDTMWNLHVNQAFGTDVYLGDGASGLYVWGWQIEVGQNFASSYIKTVASAVTRAADSLTLPLNFGQMALSVYVRFHERGSASSNSTAGMAAFGTGSTPFYRWDSFGTNYRWSNQQVAGAVVAVPAGVPTIGQLVEHVGQIAADGSVTDYQSIASGAATQGGPSAAQALVGNLSSQVITLGGSGWHGILFDLIVGRGVRSLAEFRAIP